VDGVPSVVVSSNDYGVTFEEKVILSGNGPNVTTAATADTLELE
jgi:hypothetical protein